MRQAREKRRKGLPSAPWLLPLVCTTACVPPAAVQPPYTGPPPFLTAPALVDPAAARLPAPVNQVCHPTAVDAFTPGPPEKERPAGSGVADVSAVPGAKEAAAILDRRIQVTSNGAALGSVASALGKAIQTNVVVDPWVAPQAVWIQMPDATVKALLGALEEANGAHYRVDEASIHIEARRRPAKDVDFAPLETRMIPLPSGADAGEVVNAYCAMFSSAHGVATSIGQSLVVRDYAGNLSQLEELVKALGTTVPAGSSQFDYR
jgi:hypothetical protein